MNDMLVGAAIGFAMGVLLALMVSNGRSYAPPPPPPTVIYTETRHPEYMDQPPAGCSTAITFIIIVIATIIALLIFGS